MAHYIVIPICFQFFKSPCVWEIRTVPGERLVEGVRPEPEQMLFPKRVLPGGEPQLLDGWACRNEFFRLPKTEKALLGFLTKVGVWSPRIGQPAAGYRSKEIMQQIREKQPLPIPVNGLWAWRDGLRKIMKNGRGFVEDLAPPPRNLVEAQLRLFASPSNQFALCFDLSKHPEGVVTVTNAHHMLLTTVYVDFIRGLKFRCCQRPDCMTPFHVKSDHGQKYCRQYCGHLESLRKQRRIAGQEKRKR